MSRRTPLHHPRHRPEKGARNQMAYRPGEIIRYDNGTCYEVEADGSYHRRPDIERRIAGEGNPTITKQKVTTFE